MSVPLAVILLLLPMGNVGAAARPVLSFSPNWAPILTGDNVTLTCNGARPAQGNERYTWYRDSNPIPGVEQQNYTIQGAQLGQSGRYQCQIGERSERSAALQLTVSEDKVILQAPPGAHEGEELTLRCYTRPEHKTTNTTVFYRNNSIIRPLGSDSLVLGGAQTNMSGPYSCQTKLHDKSQGVSNPYTSAEEHLSVTELFSSPQIKVSSDQVREGDHMTITCDTELSPHRETTELQFAFYRNGHNVQGFNSSKQYGVPSAQLEDSGNYTCEVQTPTGSIKKNSNVTHIRIQELFSAPQIKVSPDQMTEGDHMTITCDTKLSPHRETTELQFAFYRNETKVQEFSRFYEYKILSFALNYSGNYTCEVQALNGRVRKRSGVFRIYQNHEHNNDKDTIPLMLIIGGAVALVVLLSLLIVALCILKSKHKQHRTQSSRRATLSEPGETNLEEEVCYISINFNRQPKGHSAAQNNDDGNNVIYAAVRGNDTGNAQAGYKQAQRENSVVYAALKTPERNKNNRERRNIPQDENCVYALVKKR
ncbi:hypothetical protein XENTR_v10022686 [Xenopus tropicalis]|nr:hypothetical protein XENTR_v10022686 [Xenopus tropicalis]